MDWSCTGILVPDSHMNNRNHSLHWEVCWLFFTFSVSTALSVQILSTSHSQPLPAKETPWNIFLEEHVWFHRYWQLPTQALFLAMQGMGWTCQGQSDVLYPILCLKIVKESWKLSYRTSRLLQQGGQSLSSQYNTKSEFFPGKVLHMLWASYPLRGQDSGERGSLQCSVGIKKGDFNCSSFYHVSFVSSLVLIRIFMSKAATTLPATHESVFLLYRVNMSDAPLTAD